MKGCLLISSKFLFKTWIMLMLLINMVEISAKAAEISPMILTLLLRRSRNQKHKFELLTELPRDECC